MTQNKQKMIKYFTIIITSVFLMVGCQAPAPQVPEDLAGKKAFLSNLKSQKIDLETKITDLEKEIEKLEPNKEKPKKLVTTTLLESGDFKRYIDIQGAVLSSDAVYASPELGGRLTSMPHKEGDYVKQGALIATMDMESVEKQKQELLTTLELAKDIYNRQERLWKQEIGSEVQYLEAKNNVERLEKSLETLNFNLTKANVYAPISGYVDMVFLKKGELAGPGAPIIQIINTNTVKVVADVPESLLGKVKRGEYVEIEFPALELTRKGKVSLIGRSIDPANRTFKVEVNLSNPKGKLKPNLLSIVKINDLSIKNAITIPLEYVQQEISGKDYVYIASDSPEGKVTEKSYVVTGPTFENNIVIESGLNTGDEMILEGARGLASGDLLEIEK